jgi:chromosome segregation ATPase
MTGFAGFLGSAAEPEAPSEDEVAALDSIEQPDDDKAYIAELKAKVNELDGAKLQLSRDLKVAQTQIAELQDVAQANEALEAQVAELNAQKEALEAGLADAEAKLAKADEVLAAGKALKDALAVLA